MFFTFICSLSLSIGALPKIESYHFTSMGITGELLIWTNDHRQAEVAFAKAQNIFSDIDKKMRPWGDSDITRMNQAAGENWVSVSDETLSVLASGQKFSQQSQGLFDLTFASLNSNNKYTKNNTSLRNP